MPEKNKRVRPAQPPEVKEALELAGEITRTIDEDVPDLAKTTTAPEYFENVYETARDIGNKVERFNRVTEPQLRYLRNLLEGVRKWVHDDD